MMYPPRDSFGKRSLFTPLVISWTYSPSRDPRTVSRRVTKQRPPIRFVATRFVSNNNLLYEQPVDPRKKNMSKY
jgi:hypothetical protein